MTHNPVLVQALVEARVEELRRAAAPSGRARGQGHERHHVAKTIRRRTGWLLVAMGLRLVVSGSAAARGQR